MAEDERAGLTRGFDHLDVLPWKQWEGLRMDGDGPVKQAEARRGSGLRGEIVDRRVGGCYVDFHDASLAPLVTPIALAPTGALVFLGLDFYFSKPEILPDTQTNPVMLSCHTM